MTDVYTAIMRAADSIERHPHLFNFKSIWYPNVDCGTTGCALGWIAFHLARQPGLSACFVAALELLDDGCAHEVFYERMRELGGYGWRDGASACAATLRLYAAKYHAPKPDTGFRDFMATALPVSDHVREWRETAIDVIKTPREP